MNYKALYIFVEGNDDERFFREIFCPMLKKKYDHIAIVKYAQKKRELVKNFVYSISKMGGDYIYVTDINNSPCVTDRKRQVKSSLGNIDDDRIVVVIKEIESWYLAGLDEEAARELGIKKMPECTDDVTKEQFDNLIPKKFDSRIDFMREILKHFSIEVAKVRNGSLSYFIEKFCQ